MNLIYNLFINCAVCRGDPSDSLGKALNMSVIGMLIVIFLVLSVFIYFIISLGIKENKKIRKNQ